MNSLNMYELLTARKTMHIKSEKNIRDGGFNRF